MTNLETKEGTIAKVLTEHKNELFELVNKGDIKGCRQKTISLLDDERLSSNKAVATAKKVLSSKNDNLFLSCLFTYMSGMKVS